jgi:Bax protein
MAISDKLVIAAISTLLVACNSVPENDPNKARTVSTISKPETLTKAPDLSQISNIKKKKQRFFSTLAPIIDWENQRIRQQREQVLLAFEAFGSGELLSARNLLEISELAEEYRLNNFDINSSKQRASLLRRVDTIPRRLVFSQAANESAWGASRFAQDGNNLFGQWCFTKGCGIVPKRRTTGATHEVANFKSVNASVRAYMHNLNTGRAYRGLREIREQARTVGTIPTAIGLSEGLGAYSARGQDYVSELQSMIRVNAALMDATQAN